MSNATKLDRRFGRCTVKGCKTRRVVDGSTVAGVLIYYRGGNEAELATIGAWCTEHNRHLDWTQLVGRVKPERECNGVCMGAVGPSCDCACGGENHGKNHVG
jgi:hypothetical protein